MSIGIRISILALSLLLSASTLAATTCGPPLESWSAIEQDVWATLCRGDRSVAADDEVIPLNAGFLTDLFERANQNPTPLPAGILLEGYLVSQPLDWKGKGVSVSVVLDKMTFEMPVTLAYASFPRSLSFDGSIFNEALVMNGVQVGRYLNARGATLKSMDLRSARVDGSVYFTGIKLNGNLNLRRASITQSLAIDSPVHYTRPDNLNRSIPGYASGARIGGRLILDGADIGGLMDLRGSVFKSVVNIRRAKLGKSLLARSGATFMNDFILQAVEVGGIVDLTGSRFEGGVDLSNSTISEDLAIGKDVSTASWSASIPCTSWAGGTSIRLTNAQIYALRDSPCDEVSLSHWPSKTLLTGLRYSLLSGANQADASVVASRDADWLIRWLGLQREYSPDPYRQMADVLTTFGYLESARKVLIASKDREFAEAKNYLRKFTLGTQWLFIHYGYGFWRVAAWMLFFVALGGEVLRRSNQRPDLDTVVARMFYSFDRLIPVVKLSESHFQPELTGGTRHYFFVHTIAGFVLAAYLIAGLTGVGS